MRNQEAARYARWAAMAAGMLALAAAGAYVERGVRQARARSAAPKAVSASVEQSAAEFSFSKAEQDRTLFTIRASHATQYKDPNRAVLEDVWITIYGRQGNRNDNIHTRECSYEPDTGAVRCAGDVQISLQDAAKVSGKEPGGTLEVTTRNLSFNRDTGEASTPEPVEFRFPQGEGHGVGVKYSTSDATVRVERDVEFDLAPSERTGGLPVRVTGRSLEFHRKDYRMVLEGPATVSQGDRELTADTFSVVLDEDYHARRAIAEGHPSLRGEQGGAKISVSAGRFEGLLNPAGWVEQILAEDGISGTRQTSAGMDRFTAARAEIEMQPGHNLAKEMTASGGVVADSTEAGDSRHLETDALRITFGAGATASAQRIESAETLGPAVIRSSAQDEDTTLRGPKFTAQFTPAGRLERLQGASGVEISRQAGKAAPQVSSADRLDATFTADGQWNTLDESGNVRFQQGDRQGSAAHARIERATDDIALDGSPVLSDVMSRTTAQTVAVNQKSGEIQAEGPIISTYLPSGDSSVSGFGSGAAHISADALSGSTVSGHVVYLGHARMWQGESVLEADRIELWRDDKKMQASGHVAAIFPQTSVAPGVPGAKSPGRAAQGPTLWEVHAPLLTYWSEQGKARLAGGVVASSAEGSLESRTLDVFLNPAGSAGTPPPSNARGTLGAGAGELNRVLAQGGVVVRQGDRRGMAEQAEYTAADQKFVLSGGQPTLTDASRDTATGHSLTFYVANDTILIDSQEGSRTLTRHRVEK